MSMSRGVAVFGFEEELKATKPLPPSAQASAATAKVPTKWVLLAETPMKTQVPFDFPLLVLIDTSLD